MQGTAATSRAGPDLKSIPHVAARTVWYGVGGAKSPHPQTRNLRTGTGEEISTSHETENSGVVTNILPQSHDASKANFGL